MEDNSERIENICEEYKLKPYKRLGAELPFYFGELLEQTNRWIPFPFKPDERFIDFIRGIQELDGIKLQKFDETIHLKNDYTGFVELDPSKKFRQGEGIAPWAGFIESGEFRYAQSESTIRSAVIGKHSLFIKNKTTLEIYAVSLDDEAQNECRVVSMAREEHRNTSHKNFANTYITTILQIPEMVRIMINIKENFENRGIVENRTFPLIELDFQNEEYAGMLARLESDKNMFRDFETMKNAMGTKYVCSHSQMFNVIEKKQGWKIKHKVNTMTFNEAAYMLDYFSANNR